MGLFDKFKTVPSRDLKPTTANFFIGAPEAEAEATNTQIGLNDFFEDYLDILASLGHETFIIQGRKGSGKTAIGEHILSLANDEPNTFCKFVKKKDFNIESLVQLGKDTGIRLEISALLKWIVLTQITSLLFTNEKLKVDSTLKHLQKFIQRNRGFIEISEHKMTEIIREKSFNVNIEHLKRLVSATGGKKIHIKEEKAPFYEILPQLEEAVIEILKKDHGNEYILIFDDFDLDFDAGNQDCIDTMIELIRVARDYNNDCFGRNGLSSKLILLLRNDIAKSLMHGADTAKIFSSYSIQLNWYEDGLRDKETKIKLRQFINRRIALNFQRNHLDLQTPQDPWLSFVNQNDYWGGKTAFKYILDNTFYRPRDLILFFHDISQLKFDLPLRRKDIEILKGKYAVEIVNELTNELSLSYSKMTIDKVWESLRQFDRNHPFSYDDIKEALLNHHIDTDPDRLINDLFDYSIIGNYNSASEISFKFREKKLLPCRINKEEQFVLHYAILTFYDKGG